MSPKIVAAIMLLSATINADEARAQPVRTLANLDKCVSAQEAFQRMNNEAQVMIITAKTTSVQFIGSTAKEVLSQNVFTSDKEMKFGYRLAATPEGLMCKIYQYRNPRLLNAKEGVIDPRTLMPANIGKANSLSTAILSGNKLGENPMLQYFTSYDDGKPAIVTITGSETLKSGMLVIANLDGIVSKLDGLTSPKYQESADQTLARQR